MRRLLLVGLLLASTACEASPPRAPSEVLDPFGFAPPDLARPARDKTGDLWIASAEGEALRIEASSGNVLARVPVGAFPLDIAIGLGSVWVPSRDDGTVTRIDTRTNRVAATIEVGRRPTTIATGEGAVWVIDNIDDTLTRIDPRTNRITSTTSVPAGSWDVAAGAGAVWVAGPGEITRIDPASGAAHASYRQESFRGLLPHIAIGRGSVWVTDASTSLLWRIDPATNGFDYREVISGYPSNRAVAVSDDAIWIATLSDVVRLDPSTDEVTTRAEVSGSHIAIGDEVVWIGDEGNDRLFKLDLSTGRVIQRIPVGDVHAIAIG